MSPGVTFFSHFRFTSNFGNICQKYSNAVSLPIFSKRLLVGDVLEDESTFETRLVDFFVLQQINGHCM